MMVFAIALLLIASMVVMFHFSRQALREEAVRDAEETLEGTVKLVDNILLSIEQSTGNVYTEMMGHLDEPDRMESYCRELVKCNPYIVGCGLAFKPHYYPGRELFMVYIRKTPDSLVKTDTFGPQSYIEQSWYTDAMESGTAGWLEPLKNDSIWDEALTAFCLPILDKNNQCIAVMTADVSLAQLSQIVLDSKPSTRGYSTLLSRKGSFVVHPDPEKVKYQTVFAQTEHGTHPSVLAAAEAMVKGQSGFRPFRMNDEQWYVLFKPFRRDVVPGRLNDDLGWSIGVVYPDDDIFKEYNQLLYYLLAIAVVGLLLFFVLCRLITHRALLPLGLLTRSAQRIAERLPDEIPDTKREDEIGQLQVHFRHMQEALDAHMDEQERLSDELRERSENLQEAYDQAQEADRMKTAFLHFMTNKMIEPSENILNRVTDLCNHRNGSQKEAGRVANIVRQQGEALIGILDRLFKEAGDVSQDSKRKKGGRP